MLETTRKVIRIILPGPVRRPIADLVYRTITLYQNNREKIRNKLSASWHFSIERQKTQTHFDANTEKRNFYAYFKKGLFYKIVYKFISRCLDNKYRELLKRLEKELLVMKSTGWEKVERRGAMLMIGSLGPGGAERQTVLTIINLKRYGYAPITLSAFFLETETECFYLSHLEAESIQVKKLQEYRHQASQLTEREEKLIASTKHFPYFLHDIRACIRLFEEQRPQVVHLWLDETNIKGGIAAVVAGVPRIILSTRNLPPIYFALYYRSYMREGYLWLVRQPGVVIINNSEVGAYEYEQWLELPRGTIQVIRNGFDYDEKKLENYRRNRNNYRIKKNIPLNVSLIGTVMRFNDEKRPLLWLEVAAYIHQLVSSIHFLMVGDGPLRKKVEDRKKKLGLEEVVHCVGNEQEVLAAIAGMDLFLLTSRAEGLPNVLIEAQALGVPVVTTNAGGAAETLEHGQSGWVLESDNPKEIAKMVIKLLLDKSWCAKVSTYGPSFAKCSFSVEKMLNQTLHIYGTLINTNSK